MSSAVIPPITGALLPPPKLTDSDAFHEFKANLTALFDDSMHPDHAGFESIQTSFSIALTSIHAPVFEPAIWEYHHLAGNRSEDSTADLGGDSTYMIASISKVFTALLVLQSEITVHSPVTAYLPELNGPSPNSDPSKIQWNQITIQDLLTHLSGIPQVYGFPEIFQLVPIFEALGFSPLDNISFTSCGVIWLNDGCDRTTLLPALLSTSVPVSPPGRSPVYGTLSFVLLGLILERHNNISYAELLQSSILDPLEMTRTSISGSQRSSGDTNAVIPAAISTWGSDFGINAPGSGLVSTTTDMSKFLRSILVADPMLGLTVDEVDRWLKPVALLPTYDGAVGAPWEIYRTQLGVLTKERRGQAMDVYAKDGSVLGYYLRAMLMPGLGIGMTVLTAGEPDALGVISEAALAKMVETAVEVGRQQAEDRYSATYTVEGQNIDGNATLRVDEGPGIKVGVLYRNGSDVLAAIEAIYAQSIVGGGQLSNNWRIDPMGIKNTIVEDGQEVVLEEWRLAFEPVVEQSTGSLAETGEGVFKDTDSAWLRIDGTMLYGGRPVDRFVFKTTSDGTENDQIRGVGMGADQDCMIRRPLASAA